MSSTTAPGLSAAAIPPSQPRMASRTAPPSGSIVTTTAASANDCGEAAGSPPWPATNRSCAPGSLSRTTSAKPAAARLAAMRRPMLPMPTNPVGPPAGPPAGAPAGPGPLSQAQLGQHGRGVAEAVDGRRDAAVDGGVHQDLAQLIGGDPVVDGALHVPLDLLRAAERDQHGDGEHAARAAGDSFAPPDRAEAVPGHQFLELPGEIGLALHLGPPVLGAEHLLADRDALLVQLVVRQPRYLPRFVTRALLPTCGGPALH